MFADRSPRWVEGSIGFNLFGKHNTMAGAEVIPVQKIDKANERMPISNVKHRLWNDMPLGSESKSCTDIVSV
jgi:hypothetical protein